MSKETRNADVRPQGIFLISYKQLQPVRVAALGTEGHLVRDGIFFPDTGTRQLEVVSKPIPNVIWLSGGREQGQSGEDCSPSFSLGIQLWLSSFSDLTCSSPSSLEFGPMFSLFSLGSFRPFAVCTSWHLCLDAQSSWVFPAGFQAAVWYQ